MSARSAAVRSVLRRGRHVLVIDFSYLDADGRRQRYRRDARAETRAGASAEAKRLMDLAARTGSPEPRAGVPTLASFVEETFRPVFLPRFRPGTRTRYEGLLRQALLPRFGRSRLDTITMVAVLRFAADERARGVDPRGAGNLLRTIVRCAHEAGVLAELPRLPTFRQPEKLPEAPSLDEVTRLLDSAKGWVRVAVALTVFAGMRQGEVRALQVGDLDFDGHELRVLRAWSEKELVLPKGGKQRHIPMAPELEAILREAVRAKLPKAFIITNRRGKVPSRQAVLTALKATLKAAGLPARSFHLLRHYFCSRLLVRGANVEAVRQLAGHTKLGTTARYVHATTADARAAIACLSGD